MAFWDNDPIADEAAPPAQQKARAAGAFWEQDPVVEQGPTRQQQAQQTAQKGVDQFKPEPFTGPTGQEAVDQAMATLPGSLQASAMPGGERQRRDIPSEAVSQTVEDTPLLTRAPFEQMETPADRLARQMGIEPGGAPFDLRKHYQKVPPHLRGEHTQNLVNRYFQQKTDGAVQGVPVDYSEGLERHVYRDPADGKWRPLDTIGPDLADSWELAKYVAVPAVSGLAAALAATPTGPAGQGVAATAVDAATTAAMRRRDVQSLQEQGLLPREGISAEGEGMREGGLALLGSVVGGVGGRMIRRGVSGPGGIPADANISRREVTQLLDRWEAEYGAEAQASGLQPTLADKVNLVAKTPGEKATAGRIAAYEGGLASKRETQVALGERFQENREAVTRGLQSFMQAAGSPEKARAFRASGITAPELIEAGTRATQFLEAPARREIARYDQALTDAYTKAQQQADEVLDGSIDPTRLPEDFAGVFDAAERNFRQEMSGQYAAMEEAASGRQTFDIEPLREFMKDFRREAQEDSRVRAFLLGEGVEGVAPRQAMRPGRQAGEEVDDPIEQFFGDTFTREQSGLMVPASIRREQAAQTKFGYKEVNNALQQLRARVRQAPEARQSDAVMNRVRQLEGLLEDVRVNGLREIDPSLADRQQALDASYRLGSETLRRGIGRKINQQYLKPRRDAKGNVFSQGVVAPETFRKLFKGDAGAESARDIRDLKNFDVIHGNSDRPVDMLGVTDNIRRGLAGVLRSDYLGQTTDATGRRTAQTLDQAGLERFEQDYGHALDLAFTQEQRERIQSLPDLQRELARSQQQVEDVTARVKEFPWGEDFIADDPAQFWRRTWGPVTGDQSNMNAVQASRRYREILRSEGDPEGLISDYQTLIAHDMATKVNDPATGTFDPVKMRRYIEDHEELLKEWYTIPGQNKSGADFVNKMKSINEMAEQVLANEGLSTTGYNWWMRTLDTAARAYTGIFTMPGRILTAGKQVGGGMTSQKRADFVLNPEKYLRNQEFFEVMDSQWMKAINRSGGYEFMRHMRGDPGETSGAMELEEEEGPEVLDEAFDRWMLEQSQEEFTNPEPAERLF